MKDNRENHGLKTMGSKRWAQNDWFRLFKKSQEVIILFYFFYLVIWYQNHEPKTSREGSNLLRWKPLITQHHGMPMINYIYSFPWKRIEKTMDSKPWDQNHRLKTMGPKPWVQKDEPKTVSVDYLRSFTKSLFYFILLFGYMVDYDIYIESWD